LGGSSVVNVLAFSMCFLLADTITVPLIVVAFKRLPAIGTSPHMNAGGLVSLRLYGFGFVLIPTQERAHCSIFRMSPAWVVSGGFQLQQIRAYQVSGYLLDLGHIMRAAEGFKCCKLRGSIQSRRLINRALYNHAGTPLSMF
jgi:hypothetical protein